MDSNLDMNYQKNLAELDSIKSIIVTMLTQHKTLTDTAFKNTYDLDKPESLIVSIGILTERLEVLKENN